MKRRVSTNERLYLACAPLYPPFLIQFKVSGTGSLAADDVRRAIEIASEANPGSRLQLRGRHWIDSHRAPRLIESPLDDGLFHSPIQDATCEVVLDRNEILFRAFHGVMDARGLLLWIEDVFRSLRGEDVIGASSTMTDREAVRTKNISRQKPEAKFKPLAKGQTGWHFLQLPNEPNLVARVAAALAHLAGDQTKFMIPVDLRPFFPGIRTTGNLSNPIFLDVSSGETSAQIQAHILRELANQSHFGTSATDDLLNYVPVAIQRLAVSKAQQAMDRNERYLMSAVLSNLGRVQLSSFSTPTFQATRAISLPLDTPFCPVTVIMTEHDHAAELAVSAPSVELVSALRKSLGQEMTGPQKEILEFANLFNTEPTRTAISHGERKISYRDLDRWSTSVAAKLPKVERIAVQMKHSIELVVALLAVMKSGAAFVPIDPTLPQDRIDFIASHAQHILKEIPPCDDETISPSFGKTAYVIFTSGSTGVPKGVEVSHRSLMNYLGWAKEAYGSRHCSALFTSIGFDLTLTSIFLPLISEGEIRVYDNDPFVGLKELQTENRVSFLKATPSHLRILAPMSNVKTLVVGGEQLTTAVAANWDADVFNEYGPTEATVGCVVHKFDPRRDLSPVVPIGKPIANTRLSVVSGELVIEGDSVALGYLNQARFEGRYRTGDLVELRDDEFVYLGRADRQLKVNGVRVEPAEIEAALLSHPLVTDAVVGLNSRHQLTAYFKARESIQIRSDLEEKLARSVIPVVIEQCVDFPLSPNGKIDFDHSPSVRQEDALDPAQEKVRALVADILKRAPATVPIHETAGLDSLSLVILLDRLNVPDMFVHAHEFAQEPTVARIAATLSRLKT